MTSGVKVEEEAINIPVHPTSYVIINPSRVDQNLLGFYMIESF
jgi:hypothetical protein